MADTADHDDRCRCDGCVNVNYPRRRNVVLAELRRIWVENGCTWALEQPALERGQLELSL